MAAGAVDRERRRRWVAISAAAVLTLGGAGALLWFSWPGLHSYFKTPAVEAVASVARAVAPIVVTHAEPWRRTPPVPAAPAPGTAPPALPPQEPPRVLAVQPPLSPLPSPPPVQQVAMVAPPPAAPPQQQIAALPA